ncbi:MAG TPA: TraR/DksA C4-type zinc finger protein [Gaiellaceae bacterium]|nr:TraR/DksA C4-type zinc finger protein [Gaiellaceae bacterium]
MSTIDTQRFREALEEERARIERTLEALRGDHAGTLDDEVEEVAGTTDNHLGETASATVNREIDYSLGENAEDVLARIDAALKRIGDGTYGICTACGREIAPERLEATPWASLCIDDARRLEGA